MISMRGPQLALLAGSVVTMAVALAFVARGRTPRAWERRRAVVLSAGLLGFASGACLGAMAGWGRPARIPLLLALVVGVVLSAATMGASYQVLWLSQRQRALAGASDKAADLSDPGG
jgi:hypothetical protein